MPSALPVRRPYCGYLTIANAWVERLELPNGGFGDHCLSRLATPIYVVVYNAFWFFTAFAFNLGIHFILLSSTILLLFLFRIFVFVTERGPPAGFPLASGPLKRPYISIMILRLGPRQGKPACCGLIFWGHGSDGINA